MPQSGVGSMQGKNTGNMPSAMCASSMNESHIFTGGGRIHNVTQRTDTHIFTGGDAHTMWRNEWTHKFFFDTQNETDAHAIYWGSMLPKNELFSSSKIDQVRAFFHKSFKQAEAEVVPSLSSGILKLSQVKLS